MNRFSSYEPMKDSAIPIWAYQGDSFTNDALCRSIRRKLAPKKQPMRLYPIHRDAALGQRNLFTEATCSTYSDRFEPYTDKALGIEYREVADVHEIDFDPLLGPIKPESYTKSQWDLHLKSRNIIVNSRSIEDDYINLPDWRALSDRCGIEDLRTHQKAPRTAILFRYYEGYVMTEDQVLDMRAMLSEMVINRPLDGYDVRILVEVKTTRGAFLSKRLQEEILLPMLPREFWRLVEFWSEEMERVLLPGVSGILGYGIKTNCLLATQLFSFYHPEYDFVYNWEADVRFLGDYSTFFDKARDFALGEPNYSELHKYQKWLVHNSSLSSANWMQPAAEERGVGREADLLTFNAIIDVRGSSWPHRNQIANYGADVPWRTSVLSSIRFSKQLLKAMNLAIVENKKSMHCEALPASIVLHSHLPPSPEQTFDFHLAEEMRESLPFKAVFVPHPVYLSEDLEPSKIEETINGVDFFSHEQFMAKSTFDWVSTLPGEVYDRWRHGQGVDACRRPSFMHPIKEVGY